MSHWVLVEFKNQMHRYTNAQCTHNFLEEKTVRITEINQCKWSAGINVQRLYVREDKKKPNEQIMQIHTDVRVHV